VREILHVHPTPSEIQPAIKITCRVQNPFPETLVSDFLSFPKPQLILLQKNSFRKGLPSHFLSANAGHPRVRFRQLAAAARSVKACLRCREGRKPKAHVPLRRRTCSISTEIGADSSRAGLGLIRYLQAPGKPSNIASLLAKLLSVSSCSQRKCRPTLRKHT
jgi:hypothetical protein